MRKVYIFCTILFILVGCQRKTSENVYEQDLMDVVANKINASVDPADDFFTWANGEWFKSFPMPAYESQWGIEAIVDEEIFQSTIQICRDAALNKPVEGSIEQKIGDLWKTGMDTNTIELQELKYVEPLLEKISNVKNDKDLFAMIGQLQANNINPLFYGYVYQDKKVSSKYSFYIAQGDLNVNTHDYYLGKDAMSVKVRNAYFEYLKKTFIHLNESPKLAAIHAKCVLKIETFLAENEGSNDETGAYENYNKQSVAEWEKVTPSVKWRILLNNMGCSADSLVFEQLGYMKNLDKAFKVFAIEDWKAFLRFSTINAVSAYLPKRFKLAQFDFYGRTIDGRKEKKPQWKFMLGVENQLLGEGLGQIFVKGYFPEKNRIRYEQMVDNVKVAFSERIKELDWMSQPTKDLALKKLLVMKKKVGYPNQWRSFANMKINRSSLVTNVLNANQWWFAQQMSKLKKDVNRSDWNITPQEFNAYYSPANNEIVVPAAVLSIPGFENEQIDDAVAYGYAAAATIGHEMTHGFDMDGKEYDMSGNLKKWWTPKDSANYVKRAFPLITQYNRYKIIDTLKCRGEALWNENIADLGGVSIGLKAFKKTQQYKEGKKIAGYTPLQRFFMGYALSWMTVYTNERLTRKALTDDHAPPKWRVNGILANIPEFYEAFKVQPQHRMWIDPTKRVRVW